MGRGQAVQNEWKKKSTHTVEAADIQCQTRSHPCCPHWPLYQLYLCNRNIDGGLRIFVVQMFSIIRICSYSSEGARVHDKTLRKMLKVSMVQVLCRYKNPTNSFVRGKYSSSPNKRFWRNLGCYSSTNVFYNLSAVPLIAQAMHLFFYESIALVCDLVQ